MSKHLLLIAAVLSAILWHDPIIAASMQRGVAARYQPGLMEQVARTRGIQTAHPVASPMEPLGTRLTVCSRRACIAATVVDVCAPRDCAAIIKRGIIVELSHADARTVCGSTREPPSQCPVRVWRRP